MHRNLWLVVLAAALALVVAPLAISNHHGDGTVHFCAKKKGKVVGTQGVHQRGRARIVSSPKRCTGREKKVDIRQGAAIGAPGVATGAGTSLIGGEGEKINQAKIEYMSAYTHEAIEERTEVEQVLPFGGTLSGFNVRLDRAPGSGDSWTFTVFDGASPTGVTCTIADAATSCASAASHVFAAGGLISVESSPTNNPYDSTARWTASFAS